MMLYDNSKQMYEIYLIARGQWLPPSYSVMLVFFSEGDTSYFIQLTLLIQRKQESDINIKYPDCNHP